MLCISYAREYESQLRLPWRINPLPATAERGFILVTCRIRYIRENLLFDSDLAVKAVSDNDFLNFFAIGQL